MKHLTTAALLVVAFVLLAPEALAGQPPPPTMSYVEIDTVVMFYKDFYYSETIQQQLSAGDITDLTGQVNDVIEFVWQASHCKAYINVIEWLEIDRQYGLEQMGNPWAGKYWMSYWSSDGSTSVQTALYDAGYADGDVTLVMMLWALKTNPSDPAIAGVYGGECYMVGNDWMGGLLGDSACITFPLRTETLPSTASYSTRPRTI